MYFKVLNAYKESNVIMISGCYSPQEDEKELLEVLRETLERVNKTVDGGVQCDRFVSNSKTILFKSIPIDTLYTVLQLHNDCFNLKMKVVMGKNMKTNSLKDEVYKYFNVHSFKGGNRND